MRLPRLALAALVAATAAAFLPCAPARAQVDQQQLVNQALATVEQLKSRAAFKDVFASDLAKARAIVVIPNFYNGAFILGAQFGNGVMLARRPDGSFGYPAFLAVAGGSVGLQIGANDVSVALLVMTPGGLEAILTNHFKLGADAGATMLVIGAEAGAASTTALGADILAFSESAIGLYGGVALKGSVLSSKDSWNAAYYGHPATARDIVTHDAERNPGADALRDFLAH